MYDMEKAVEQTLKDIEAMEAVNAVLPAVKKVIEKWAHKVLNKRLETALEGLNLPGYIYLQTCYETCWSICYKPENARDYYTILSGTRPSCRYYDETKSFVDTDKRIIAARAFEIIEAGRVDRLKKITAYREHLETWEAKKQQIEFLKKQINAITASIPYEMLDYFNMRTIYR